MNAKEYLSQIKRFDLIIGQKKEQLEELRSSLTNVVADPSKEHVSGGMSGEARFTKTVERIVVLEKELDDHIQSFFNHKHTIVTQIQMLENINYSCVLYERYVRYRSFEEIADAMNYSISYVRTLHGWALLAFSKKYAPFAPIPKHHTK